MKTTIRLLALLAVIVGIGLVNVAAVSGGPATVSTASSVNLSGTSGGTTSKAAKPADADAPAAVAPAAAPAAKADKTGQLDYTPPNADVPEGRRPGTGDATCPGTEPCGP